MEDKKTSLAYRLIRGAVKLFYPKIEVVGTENLPDGECIIAGNHTQMNGPIACELYMPGNRHIWCAGEMMHWKEVPAYAYRDFWSQKSKFSRLFYKLLAYLITPLSVCVLGNAHTIPVYHDSRALSTFKITAARLQEGGRIVIFPEHDVKYNHILCQFQDKFVDIAKLHYKRTGKELSFLPLYIAPKLKRMYLGRPIRFCAENSIEQERSRICSYLMEEITRIACGLPEHTVIPYRNIPKKLYPSNIPKEAANETAHG